MASFWEDLASKLLLIRNRLNNQHLVIAIDGVDGSGKTQFAKKLGETLKSNSNAPEVLIISIDDFHNEKKFRYRQGRDSAVGFFEDSFDYDRLIAQVLQPIRNSSGQRVSIITKAHDLKTDHRLEIEPVSLSPLSIVIIEGIFIQRPEIIEYMDFKIFLDVPFAESVYRMSVRDGTVNDQNHSSLTKYIGGQKIYFERCSPQKSADLVIDNTNFNTPLISSMRDIFPR